jgi:hypothetical protein
MGEEAKMWKVDYILLVKQHQDGEYVVLALNYGRARFGMLQWPW